MISRTALRATVVAWTKLLALSAVGTLILESLHLPAAFLLGPMLAAIVTTRWGDVVRVPAMGFLAAQAVVAAMIVRSMPVAVLAEAVRDWPLYLSAVGAVMLACNAVGWLFMRRQILP
ncbi:MAG: AbrB family transcriptional regulator, partial [Alphaproteobacteria bacterium]|nr:AbrB family transcriptional regulator [Alphaproteobacteria bacterium]